MAEEKKRLKALIADDSKLIRNMVSAGLAELECFDIDEARDGNEACELLSKKIYDIILLDWTMPGQSGAQVLEKVRTGEGPNRKAAVFMVTAEHSKDRILEIAKLGVQGYVVKPFVIESLKKRIEAFLKKSGLI